MKNELMEYDESEVIVENKGKGSISPEQAVAIAQYTTEALKSAFTTAMEYDTKLQTEAMQKTVEAQKNVLDERERAQYSVLESDLKDKEFYKKIIVDPNASSEDKRFAYKKLDDLDASLERKYMGNNEVLMNNFKEARHQTCSRGFFGQLLSWLRW